MFSSQSETVRKQLNWIPHSIRLCTLPAMAQFSIWTDLDDLMRKETGSVVDDRQERRVLDMFHFILIWVAVTNIMRHATQSELEQSCRTYNKLKKLINCLQILNLGLGSRDRIEMWLLLGISWSSLDLACLRTCMTQCRWLPCILGNSGSSLEHDLHHGWSW